MLLYMLSYLLNYITVLQKMNPYVYNIFFFLGESGYHHSPKSNKQWIENVIFDIKYNGCRMQNLSDSFL